MVKLTADLIAKQAPGHNKRRADETVEHYLSRLTHLPFQNRAIDSIDSIPPCRLLTVIYLYDNQLTKIENLNFAENLTHLYLQNNRLQKMENFHSCLKLQKLYLGGNQIQVLEGLEQCSQLTEIYIENQHLPDGEKLLFDPRTLQSLSNVLEVLNVSGNNLDTLSELNCLVRLQELSASNNQLENLREMVTILSIWPRLKRLDLSRNPLCSKARYRERLIVVSNTLEMLDGKQITENSRQFLMSWKASREAQQSKEKVQSNLTDRAYSFLPNIRPTITRVPSLTIRTPTTDFHRNIFKADVGMVRKGQFPMAFIENTSRRMTARKEAMSGFFASNSFNSAQTSNSNHDKDTISFHDPTLGIFLK